jgi:N-acetyl-alpha-D-muramate 1-phosphate uridylyltransferase
MGTQVAILVEGMVTRLGELTKSRPNSLIEILHKSSLAYQLELLSNKGITDVVLYISCLGAQIRDTFGDGHKYGVCINYSMEDKPLGTAGALKNAESLLTDIFFVMYGDSYLFLDFQKLLSYFIAHYKLRLATAYRNYDLYDKSNMVIGDHMVVK